MNETKLLLLLISVIILFGNKLFSEEDSENIKYYGIQSACIEYKKPDVLNEYIKFYFHDYGNYIYCTFDVSKSQTQKNEFDFKFIFTPDSGFIFWSNKTYGNRTSTIEYPYIFKYDFLLREELKHNGLASAIWKNNYRYSSYDNSIINNMRGFIRYRNGGDTISLEKSMKLRGFDKKGNINFLNKECLVWDNSNNIIDTNTFHTEIYTWNGIVLHWKAYLKEKNGILLDAINIKENFDVPFSRFERPYGFKWYEWPVKYKEDEE